MLTALHIENLAVVERLELALRPGFTVFTGESGTGKSIVVESIGLALGNRAETGLVRSGAARAAVSAVFEISALPAIRARLEAQGIAPDAEDGQCILTRHIETGGRSRAFVNGTPVTNRVLQSLGEELVDIHGQHAHQSLLRRETHRQVLDGFIDPGALAGVARCWAEWHECRHALEGRPEACAGDAEAELDLLRYQVTELEAAGLGAEDLDLLEQEHRRLAHLAQIIDGCEAVLAALESGTPTVLQLLSQARKQLQGLLAYEARLEPALGLLAEAVIPIEEAALDLRRTLGAASLDPERLRAIEQRLADLQALARKHRVPMSALGEHLSSLKERLAQLENGRERTAAQHAQLRQALTQYRQQALALHRQRAETAPRLAGRIVKHLRALGMPRAELLIEVQWQEQALPAPQGSDQIEILVSTNPGEPPRPLAQVASGGELSRIGLGIQVVNVAQSGVGTLVFDEVDAGIGGAVAEIAGRQLRELGARRQVLCVTHLPQVASLGHQHVSVSKQARHGHSETTVRYLDGPARVEEIARMLGGLTITRRAMKHAEEMLEQVSAG
ncbi:MAG: DNA repair protein RecN [Gammaproteobacteria bacterium]